MYLKLLIMVTVKLKKSLKRLPQELRLGTVPTITGWVRGLPRVRVGSGSDGSGVGQVHVLPGHRSDGLTKTSDGLTLIL